MILVPIVINRDIHVDLICHSNTPQDSKIVENLAIIASCRFSSALIVDMLRLMVSPPSPLIISNKIYEVLRSSDHAASILN